MSSSQAKALLAEWLLGGQHWSEVYLGSNKGSQPAFRWSAQDMDPTACARQRLLVDQLPGDSPGPGLVPDDGGHPVPSTEAGAGPVSCRCADDTFKR